MFRRFKNQGYENLSYSPFSFQNPMVQSYSVQPVQLRIETGYLIEMYSPDICACDYWFCDENTCNESSMMQIKYSSGSRSTKSSVKNFT